MNSKNEPLRLDELQARWRTLMNAEPKLRIRAAAERLFVSEAQLVAAQCGAQATMLRCEPASMLLDLRAWGAVMVLTRNHAFVHEREGRFESVEIHGPMGLVLGPDIDLRCFLSQWVFAFAVHKETSRGALRSVQFFDASGDAVFKVYLRDGGDLAEYADFVARYTDTAPELSIRVSARPERPAMIPDREIDVRGFREAWLGMKDTHEFFGMLRKFGVAREQGMRLAPAGYSVQLPTESFELLLQNAAAAATPIMVFVANRGNIQIHSGPIQRVKKLGAWFNVLDPDFNLHADTSKIASVWRVRKPTEDGIVTSLEVFDEDGVNLSMIFGVRKPGVPECETWRDLVEGLPT